MDKRIFGIVATIASATMFGFLPLLVKSIYDEGTNPMSCVVIRFSVALPMIYLYLRKKGVSLKLTKKEFKDLFIISVFGFGGTSILLFSSYMFIPSGMATTIHFMYPMLTMVGLTVIMKEKLTGMKILAQILCVGGILLFYTTEDGGANIVGIILAAVSSCTYAFYTIYLGNSDLHKMDDFKALFYMSLISAVCVFIMALCTDNVDFTLSTKGWMLILVFAILASFVGSIGYQWGVRYIGGQASSILSTFEPVTSVIVGAFAYNEAITGKTVLGCIAIISAAVITAIITEKHEEKTDENEMTT